MTHEDLISAEPDLFDPLTHQRAEESVKIKREADQKTAHMTLEIRQGAYRRVFSEGTPSRDDRAIVLADLGKFCRHNQSAFHENDRVHCMLSGRQEAYLRIDDYLRMTVDELITKYTGDNSV